MRVVCPNYDVVVFQPLTVTPPHLDSVAYCYTFKLGLPSHLSLPFYGSFFLLLLTASPSVSVYCLSLLSFHPLPTSSPGAKRHPPGRFPHPPPSTCHPPPTSLCRSSLRPAPCACVYRCFLLQCAPPFPTLGLQPGPYHPLGGLHVVGSSTPLCTCFNLPELSSKSWHSPVLGLIVWCIFARGQESRAPPLHGSYMPWYLLPFILSHAGCWPHLSQWWCGMVCSSKIFILSPQCLLLKWLGKTILIL